MTKITESKRNLRVTPVSSVSELMEQNPSKKTELTSETGADIKQKWKKIFVLAAFGVIGFCANAQVNVLPNGNVSIGTAYPTSKFHISNGGKEFIFKPNNPGPEISVNYGNIKFWHSTWSWHELHAKKFVKSSDSTLKENILPLEYGTDILKRIKTYSYYYKSDALLGTERKRDYGILAQEIEEILPDLVSTVQMEDETVNKLVNYDGFIPILINGFKEQQTLIEQQQTEIAILQDIAFGQELDLTELYELRDRVDVLQNTVNLLREVVLRCCKEGADIPPIYRDTTNNNKSQIQQEPILYQNTPNPFSANTEIACDIPEVNTNAFIYVYNLQGIELKSFPVTQGYNTVTIYASELPAGMYLYTLVVDNQIVDTKRMILTK